ncbi:hypothetical protein [Tenacibaculum geojense]|uniref:Late embryogenesis abundant protein LEA-2 subgroup domain-containing protein n=1 Tax=Tenacibaculum geojense TaxID=915352 RepID=A0ABW3JNN6_9FLAO
MKKLVYFLLLFTITWSCSVKKPPVFIKVDDIKVLSYKNDTIRLQANAYFKNENDIGGKIATDEIKVIINGAEVAQVSSDEFKVPARKNFFVPLKVVVPAKKVFENNKQNFLEGLLNSLLNKSVKVQFVGDIKYKVFGYSNIYPINQTEEIKIKL